MKSRIFLCLLLIVAMFAFVGCGDNSATGTLEDDASRMMDDVNDGIDRMTDDMMDNTTDRDYGVNDNYRNDDPVNETLGNPSGASIRDEASY
ncbi:MAG: hypothetical protein IJP24_00780 [Firmicutes bacterium]|nr:hypothetical protein [Bacillota bacterium]MBQ3123336.1 hypothetical protein [Bacillota bacterium]MBQ9972030.1 hypothetical protein [Bacillota bacterium]